MGAAERAAAVEARPSVVRALVGRQLKALHPAYFAMAMATGIVSLASYRLGLIGAAELLFWINIAAYAGVWLVTAARILFHREAFLADWTSHQRGPGFFTSVAATSVLGMQFVVLRGDTGIGFALWVVAFVLWLVCTYAIFVGLSIREEKPTLAEGINGGWLLAVVATQSICVLGCAVLPARLGASDLVLFLLASFWLCGGMLYIWMISLIFYRYTFFRFSATDLMPPYWINMGAVAISTLAGTGLLAAAKTSPLLASLAPFVKGFTILYWATATWWIPMLIILGIWRHVVRRIPVAYDPLYWGLVFPFGMYAVCTYQVATAFGLPALAWLARGFVVAALAAWTLTFFGLMARFLYLGLLAFRSGARGRRSQAPVIESHGAGSKVLGGLQ
ncbi:MAG: tellurite resistance/C4-dicarboxylate transporter family protein [Deltaproteobacteria bacterium]|nr:tellurite resistance/C4-dicarboxylate transporter family protein [Deltaproteobacteria bacterium]